MSLRQASLPLTKSHGVKVYAGHSFQHLKRFSLEDLTYVALKIKEEYHVRKKDFNFKSVSYSRSSDLASTKSDYRLRSSLWGYVQLLNTGYFIKWFLSHLSKEFLEVISKTAPTCDATDILVDDTVIKVMEQSSTPLLGFFLFSRRINREGSHSPASQTTISTNFLYHRKVSCCENKYIWIKISVVGWNFTLALDGCN